MTTIGIEPEPTDVQALVANLLADLEPITDHLVRYSQLTSDQALYTAFLKEIRRMRGAELIAMSETASYAEVAEATGLGTKQRVGQVMDYAR